MSEILRGRAKRRCTLSDVAARAGVSRTTASYILNGRSDQMRIAAETQHRVHRAAEELGYRPNRAARSLRTSSTGLIGLISDHLAAGRYAGRMLHGASGTAHDLDHLLVVADTGGDPQRQRLLIDELIERQVDGIVFATVAHRRVTVPDRLTEVPTVLLNCVDPQAGAPTVVPDEERGGRDAVRTLLDAGLGDIHLVGLDPEPTTLAGPHRLAGIEDELAAAGLTLGGIVDCDWRVRDARAAVGDWVDAGGRAEGLICLNDRIAFGTYQALAERGLEVPRDVSVVSFDGSELAGWLQPAVTSMALPFEAMGELAVRLLMDRSTGSEEHRVPMTLTPGGSVRSS